jgi:hypothetical protein
VALAAAVGLGGFTSCFTGCVTAPNTWPTGCLAVAGMDSAAIAVVDTLSIAANSVAAAAIWTAARPLGRAALADTRP